jgi:hypothetical protein
VHFGAVTVVRLKSTFRHCIGETSSIQQGEGGLMGGAGVGVCGRFGGCLESFCGVLACWSVAVCPLAKIAGENACGTPEIRQLCLPPG